MDDDCDGIPDDACLACDVVVPRDHATVQDAIDAAITGDRVCVGPGTWVEHLDFGGAEITLLGALGAEATTIDGDETTDAMEPVVRFASGEGS